MASFLVLLCSVLIVSGLCSMTEAAILSLPLVKARILSEEKRKGSWSLLLVKENIHLAVATIVILNNAVNIIGSIYVGNQITQLFGSRWLGAISAIFTLAIIIISEVIPKTIGEHYKVAISLIIAKPLRTAMFFLRPLVGIISLVTDPFRKKKVFQRVTEEEIKMMLKLGRDEGTVAMEEEILCNRVFKLNDLKAFQMMKPLENVYAFDANRTIAEIRDAIINSPYSRIVVFDGDLSNIVGVCQQRVLLREIARDNESKQVKELMSRPIFVNDHEQAGRLLEKFRDYHQHLFVVQDAKKQNIGIMTMEDVLEELFGEIYDEKDSRLA